MGFAGLPCLWAHVEVHPVGAGKSSRDPRHGPWVLEGHVAVGQQKQGPCLITEHEETRCTREVNLPTAIDVGVCSGAPVPVHSLDIGHGRVTVNEQLQ